MTVDATDKHRAGSSQRAGAALVSVASGASIVAAAILLAITLSPQVHVKDTTTPVIPSSSKNVGGPSIIPASRGSSGENSLAIGKETQFPAAGVQEPASVQAILPNPPPTPASAQISTAASSTSPDQQSMVSPASTYSAPPMPATASSKPIPSPANTMAAAQPTSDQNHTATTQNNTSKQDQTRIPVSLPSLPNGSRIVIGVSTHLLP